MADAKKPETGKTGEGKPINAVNPRGAENANPFDKATERRDNQLPDESKQGNTNLQSVNEGMRTDSTNQPARQQDDSPFVAFSLDMVQLSELYANLRDGNYWSAFRQAVEILHNSMTTDPKAVRGTPTQRANARMAARAQMPVKQSQIIDIKEKLNECCDDLEKQQSTQLRAGNKEAVGASQEKNVGKVDLAGLLALVRMILGFLQES